MEDIAVHRLPVGFRVEAGHHERTRQSSLEAERRIWVSVPLSLPVPNWNTRIGIMHEYHLNTYPF